MALVLSAGAAAGASPTADLLAPTGAIGGLQSPVRGTLQLTVDAGDRDSGLAVATAFVDGVPAASVTLGTGCAAVDPAAAPEPPLAGCTREVTAAPLPVDLSAAAVGTHRLQVRVTDTAGNASILYDGEVAVAGPDPIFTSTVNLSIGDPRANARATSGTTLSDTTTAAGPTCARPRLSMWLDERPLRVQHGKPVLRRSARYRYRGRLTCIVGDRVRGAPRGTPVDILYRLGRKTTAVTGATTVNKGRLTVILAYRSSRTLLFRYRSASGSSTVRLPIVVTRKAR